MQNGKNRLIGLACLLFVLALGQKSFGWAHQGHILITRLAALRIINDPTAPQGLRDFLKANMPYTMDDCKDLATVEIVGGSPGGTKFDHGLDHWVTMPDQLRDAKKYPEAQHVEPYGVPEGSLHFLDMEDFSPDGIYKDDLSGKPDITKIPRDLTDPRWKLGGFVPLRIEEMYHRLAAAIGSGDTVAQPDKAAEYAGFLAHYTEDCTQPHHSTVDFKSITYLAGRIKELPNVPKADRTLAAIRLPRSIDPHGDIEYQLYEDAKPPRDEYRKEFWADLTADIDRLAKERNGDPSITAENFDPFMWTLQNLSDGYDYLPFVGRAAQAAYASGKFDPTAYFPHEGETHGQKMTIIELIALRNAKAVLDVDKIWRLAWDEAHRTKGS